VYFSLKRDWKAALLALAILGALSLFADVRVHAGDAKATVLSANVPPQKWPPHNAYAQVRLDDGRVISAWVLTGPAPRVGDTASVRIYKRAFTGRLSYEILSTSRPARPN
jgi:hypothetical protein